MKAVTYDDFGGTDKLKLKTLEIPQLKEGEVLVRVKAAGINPADIAVREGMLKDKLPYQFPVIPGWDMAGIIEERGYSARRFNVGDEVYAYARRPMLQYGTFAEYIAIPESYLALRPKNLKWEESGGIPLAGLTAYQSLFDVGNLEAFQTVLILGASGGVGSFAVQLAKAQHAEVIAVVSKENADYVKELGASYTIDYKQDNIAEQVKEIAPRGVDLIFDCVSGDTLKQSLAALSPRGKLVSTLNNGTDLPEGIDFKHMLVEPNSRELEHLCEFAEAEKLKVHVSKTYPLEKAAEAFKNIASHHTRGKLVIVM